MSELQTVHEPFIRMAKRDGVSFWQGMLVRACAILAALIVCSGLILWITGLNPLYVYRIMWESTFGSSGIDWKFRMITIWDTLRDTMILLCVALALTPAFKMKFWNIGGEGQILVGGLATAAVMR